MITRCKTHPGDLSGSQIVCLWFFNFGHCLDSVSEPLFFSPLSPAPNLVCLSSLALAWLSSRSQFLLSVSRAWWLPLSLVSFQCWALTALSLLHSFSSMVAFMNEVAWFWRGCFCCPEKWSWTSLWYGYVLSSWGQDQVTIFLASVFGGARSCFFLPSKALPMHSSREARSAFIRPGGEKQASRVFLKTLLFGRPSSSCFLRWMFLCKGEISTTKNLIMRIRE